jgi:hypothetical protein
VNTFWNGLATVVYPLLFFVFGCYVLLALIGHLVVMSRAKQLVLYSCAALFAASLATTNGYLALPISDIIKPLARVTATLALVLLLHQLAFEFMQLWRHGKRTECD